jgi:ATP-binding cassette subfamily F protein uup
VTTGALGRAILSVQNIVKGYGAQPVLDKISLTIHEGERIGLIGRNGCGKSTLMRIFAGLDTPEEGLVTRMAGTRVSLLGQQCVLDRAQTVGQVLQDAARERRQLLEDYHAIMERLGATPAGAEHDRLQAQFDTLHHAVDVADAWNLEQEARRVSTALDLVDSDRVLSTLSGGELRRVDLASKLLQHPDVLLLDEPTNHIDTRSVEWIEGFLQEYTGSCVLVTHDRYFLDRAVNRIVELEFQRVYSFPGNYTRFLEYKEQVETAEARAENNRLSFLRRELDWVRRGPKARGTKAKARLDRYYDAVDQGPPERHREFEFEIPEPQPLGKTVLEAREVYFGYDGPELIQKFSCAMQKNMRVGIVGPNGSGKSTLLKLLLRQIEPRKGKVIVGDNTAFLYVGQVHDDIHPAQTIIQYVSGGSNFWEVNKRRIHVPAYLEKFLFDRAAVHAPIGNLSGGERNRLVMVKQLLRGGNFLVLDEPTNDLDLYTLRVLEEALEAFEGSALIVSHDRFFLNRVCTHMWIFEGDGEIVQIAGNYDDYLLFKQRQAEDAKIAKDAKGARPAAAAAPAPAPITPPSRKMTYKEKLELDGMEAAIFAAEDRIAKIEARLADPSLYERPHSEAQGLLNDLSAAKTAVEALYARWGELERLK